jgi:hypothetical protein
MSPIAKSRCQLALPGSSAANRRCDCERPLRIAAASSTRLARVQLNVADLVQGHGQIAPVVPVSSGILSIHAGAVRQAAFVGGERVVGIALAGLDIADPVGKRGDGAPAIRDFPGSDAASCRRSVSPSW